MNAVATPVATADGLTEEDEWLTSANVDVPEHSFKGDIAVPWLLPHAPLRMKEQCIAR